MPRRLVASAGWPPIRLDRALVVVGRHPDCDTKLDSPRVSRWHCCLTEVDGEVWVRDLGSTNGTWIDGRRASSGRLRCGDVLAIAHLRYRVEEVRAEPASWADRPSTPNDGLLSLADPPGTAMIEECTGSA
jgi:predicted component of type VI protein secretion system